MKRTPLKRKKPMGKPKRTRQRIDRDAADRLWSKLVRHYAGNKCDVCGRSDRALNAHHMIGKGQHCTRHDLRNGQSLCSIPCHKFGKPGKVSAHADPEAYNAWMQANRPEKWEYIQTNRNRHGDKTDFTLNRAALAELAKQEGLL